MITIRRALTRVILLSLTYAAGDAPAQDHSAHEQSEEEAATPARGSGTSWLPASSPRDMFHFNRGDWNFMVHGFANFSWQRESEPRGTDEFFSTNMGMFSAGRGVGKGAFSFRFMATLEPTLGSTGYPLLLQTGETADGTNPLFDRQHPHDVLMEVALSYERPVGDNGKFFAYFAPVGDPAIGPTAFMHRMSGVDNPVAPITHHWLDATHISYGVLTFGWSRSDTVKLEGSIFNGREPDAKRWNVEKFALDSYAFRLSISPKPNWSLQASMARLTEPERLHPSQNVLRMTASVTYNRPLNRGNWQSTVAWGRNKWDEPPGAPAALPPGVHIHFTPGVQPTRSAVLGETGLRLRNRHTVFARGEWAEKDELFRAADRRHSLVYNVGKLNVGYIFDFLTLAHARVGVGAYGGAHWVPKDLEFVYGERPTSYGVFFRFKII